MAISPKKLFTFNSGSRKALVPPNHMDDTQKHDPLDQYADEQNELLTEEIEKETGTAEVTAAEVSAVNTDTEVAMEATEMVTGVAEAVLETEAALVEEALTHKHKNRESTSEKAKKAAEVRKIKGESVTGAPVKKLDPLRLRGKKYRVKFALVDKNKLYTLEEAVALVKQTSLSSFDGAVDMHIKIKAENTRGTIALPHGTGKSKKVAIATDDILEEIASGKYDFEVLIATPAQMPKLAKFAKILGPKGLMPSPKAGTVTDNPEAVAKEISGGRIEYRTDKNGVIHATIGRVSFTDLQLTENYRVLEQVLLPSKISAISLAPTMGPGVRVQLAQ